MPKYAAWVDPVKPTATFAMINKIMEERIMVIDGAMGTAVQAYKLKEEDFRGERFKNHTHDLKGNNDILVITRPDVVEEIHMKYLEAGADIIETNTFNSTMISQLDYELDQKDVVYDLNKIAAQLAKKIGDQKECRTFAFTTGPDGPDRLPQHRHRPQRHPLVRRDRHRGEEPPAPQRRHVLLVETIFDTLNAKAAMFAIDKFFANWGQKIPVFVSGTIVDNSGRTLSGQTNEAFWNSMSHSKPIAIGLNCALGAKDMVPYMENLSKAADCWVFCYPNAGLPNAMGGYDQKGHEMAEIIRSFAEAGWLNVVGGCCGTTPSHIKAIAEVVEGMAPRPLIERKVARTDTKGLKLSGLEPLKLNSESLTSRAPRFSRRPSSTATTRRLSRSPSSRPSRARRSSTSTWTRACSTASPR